MQKKAEVLPLIYVMIAIIVIVALIVSILIFTGYTGTRLTPKVAGCGNSGGTCPSLDATDSSSGASGPGSGQSAEYDSDCGESGYEPCPGNQCNPALQLGVDGKCRPGCASLGGIGGNCRPAPCDPSKNEELSATKASCSSSTSFCCVTGKT